MGNKSKKLLSFVAAMACVTSTVAFAACGKTAYKGDALDGAFDKADTVDSNGGFAVEKGDYVYFINGAEEYTASNEYGEVVKGALMRISKTDLANKVYTNVKTVVPSLFVAQNFDAGIYMFENDEYVYYATPTTSKNLDGDVENSYIDLKRAKLDGSEGPEDYFFRLSDNAANYRFVQEDDGVVYCLYEEDGALKSYNTENKVTTTLVSGDSVTYYYDKQDLDNGTVYYTMNVVADVDSDYATTASYNQLYRVNASATVVEFDGDNAYYKTSSGREYDFDEEYLKEQNEKAKKNKTDEPYDLDDYTTYPYVNLGELVLDGIGKNSVKDTQFNEKTDATPETTDGYTYTVTNYANGGVYFTRTEIAKTESEGENTKLYYLSDGASEAAAWDAVSGNKAENLAIVAANTTNTASALFFKEQSNVSTVSEFHSYVYVADGKIYKVVNGGTPIEMTTGVGEATLYKLEGNYLYYYATNSDGSGNNLSRINYKGSKEDYNPILSARPEKADYQPITVSYIDWNSSWYKPEFIGNTVLYSNAEAIGAVSYNYIYAATLGDTATVKANNEAYEKVQEYIDGFSANTDLQTAMTYYFRAGVADAFGAVEGEYDEYQVEKFQEFVDKFKAEGEFAGKKLSDFTASVGKMTDADKEAIDEAWAATLRQAEEEEEDEGLPTYAIVLIIVGSVLIVAAGVLIPLLIIHVKKKKAAEEEAENTVNAYKHRIDTTDDKSIDVYSDDEEETESTETAEEPEKAQEATTEETEQAPVEETVEESAEEAAEAPASEPVEESPVAEETLAEEAPQEAPVTETTESTEEKPAEEAETVETPVETEPEVPVETPTETPAETSEETPVETEEKKDE